MIEEENKESLKKSLPLLGAIKHWTKIYGITAIVPVKGTLIGNAVLYIVLKGENNGEDVLQRIFRIKMLFDSFVSRLILPDWQLKVLKEIKPHALRSAVAAIMARNMSHNIGSHVLNYLSNPEEIDKLWIL